MNRALISYTEYMLDLMNNKDPKPVIAENAGLLYFHHEKYSQDLHIR